MNHNTAIFAGGCFWGVEDIFRKLKGVITTQVGYIGGNLQDPTYEQVKTGSTGHAEAIMLTFDPNICTYEDLLALFFQMHNPTTLNSQGNDVGSQYRSHIFAQNDEQKKNALNYIKALSESHVWNKPIVTLVTNNNDHFYDAEEFHQDYLKKNPNGYTCHYIRQDKAL